MQRRVLVECGRGADRGRRASRRSAAIVLIVKGYVSPKDWKALNELRTQRRKLIADLNACTGIDCTSALRQIEEDIVVIETGLARLGGATTR